VNAKYVRCLLRELTALRGLGHRIISSKHQVGEFATKLVGNLIETTDIAIQGDGTAHLDVAT
jgi:hypothetical protein